MFLNQIFNKGYEAKHCQLCQVQFNLMKLQRIHKCKRCEKFICKECGKHRQKVIDQQGRWTKETHRICKLCKQDFLQIHDTIQQNGLEWNKDTMMSVQWLQNIKKGSEKQKNYEYGHFLKLFLQNLKQYETEVQIIDKDVVKGRTDSSVFNFSMRQFFYTVKSDIDDKVSRDNIKNVLYALAARYDRIGYCQGMSGVAAFLLCFSSQKTAFTLFCDLLQNVYPQDFFLQNDFGTSLSGLLAESYFIQQYFIHYLEVVKKPFIIKLRGEFYDQSQILHFRTIIELVCSKALLSLFVGLVSFSNCIFIWKEIKQHRSLDVIEKAFMAIIYLNRQKILQNRSFKVLEQIFQRMNLDEYKEFYQDVQIDQNIRKQLLKEYQDNVNKKWSEKPEQQNRKLQRITSFTQKQLTELKSLFPEVNGTSIKIEEFQQLIKIYYAILKDQCKNDTVLQTKQYFVRKIFKSFDKKDRQGLDYREFILCLSICTKSGVKERIRAIINTFKDENELISFENFEKLIKNIGMISDEKMFQEKKEQFSKRMDKYFQKQQKIHFKELQILLNDDFINELSFIVKSECENIILKMIDAYKKEKVKHQSV